MIYYDAGEVGLVDESMDACKAAGKRGSVVTFLSDFVTSLKIDVDYVFDAFLYDDAIMCFNSSICSNITVSDERQFLLLRRQVRFAFSSMLHNVSCTSSGWCHQNEEALYERIYMSREQETLNTVNTTGNSILCAKGFDFVWLHNNYLLLLLIG